MSDSSLKGFLNLHKDLLSRDLYRKLSDLPWNTWQEFFLRTEKGQGRFETWLNLLIDASEGSTGPEQFFLDQTHAAYERAVQGYKFDDYSMLYVCALRSINELISKEGKEQETELYKSLANLFDVLLSGIVIVSKYTLKTREEILNEKVFHLESLQDFTRDMIKSIELGDIVGNILKKSKSIFKTKKSYLSLYSDERLRGVYIHPKGQMARHITSLMERSFRDRKDLFIDISGNVHEAIDSSNPTQTLCLPIRAHSNCLGVLALHAGKRGALLSTKELNLLYQLLQTSAIALENAYMFKEIEQSRQELRFLTEKMITIQEEERKHLAADIHDSLAQVLTGIGYKIQVCKELITKNPRSLADQLDNLSKIVNSAIYQSRELISTLRPDLLDDVGLIAALKRFLNNYSQETDIEINADMPDKVQMSPELNICLFRVVQEALSNVYKHADTKHAEVTIKKMNDNITLVVSDDGKGFEIAPYSISEIGVNKIGLLSMKERVEATGGKLFIYSALNQGCRIELRIPIQNTE